MKRNYYCLVAGLQDITLDVNKLNYGVSTFVEDLKVDLHPEDYNLLMLLFLHNDHKNLLNILQKKEESWHEPSGFSRQILEEAVKEPADIPAYMARFIEAFKEKNPVFPQLSPENELTALFYEFVLNIDNEFLRNWFQFDMNLRNVLAALNSRKHHLPYEDQIIGSDEIAESIRRSHARDFGLANEFPFVEELVNINKSDDLLEREWNLDMMRWKYLDEVSFFEYFTAEKVFAFVIRMAMVERWLSLDKDMGKKLFLKLLDELKASYKLPDQFTEK